MALFKILKGASNTLSSSSFKPVEGYVYFTEDTHLFYIGVNTGTKIEAVPLNSYHSYTSDSASSAISDGNDNAIASTYATKDQLTATNALFENKLDKTATAVAASKLASAKTLQTNLSVTSGQSFDGSGNATEIGIKGLLTVAHGGTGIGELTKGQILYGNGTNSIYSRSPADVLTDIGAVSKAGSTMTGLLTLSGDPTTNLGAATKQYVDKYVTHLVVGTQTASTSSWTGNIDIDALYNGCTIMYFLPYASTSDSVTLNLTLKNSKTTGAVDCYFNASSRLTTHYGAGSVIRLTYLDGTQTINGTALGSPRWSRADYNTNTTYSQVTLDQLKAGDATAARLISASNFKQGTNYYIDAALDTLAVTAPTASGTATSFITSVSQTKGKISATKASLPTASTSAAGIVQLGASAGTSTTMAATPSAITNAINDLSVSAQTGSASKTLTSISEENGKIKDVTYSDIAIAASQVTQGSLPIARGGTGGATQSAAINNLQVWGLSGGTSITGDSELNLNNYKTVGNFYCNATVNAQLVTNNPYSEAKSSSMAAFTMKVFHSTGGSDTYLKQQLQEYNKNYYWIRHSSNSGSTWSAWHPVGASWYGTCATAADTVAKVVVCSTFSNLYTGVTIRVKFTNSNTATNPTLNVNGSGAKAIKRYGTTATGTSATASWYAGSVITFTYDGTNWIQNDYKYNTNTDTQVNVTLGTTTKAYLLGTSTAPTSTAAAVTAIADTGVYLDTTAGRLTATSFGGSGAALTSLNASNIGSGTLAAARLPTSGATAGSYGLSADATPAHSASFNVPYITVDTYGRVTSITNHSVTLPADNNTDTLVLQGNTTTSSWRKILLSYPTYAAATTAVTSSTNQVYQNANISVQPSTGTLYATKFQGDGSLLTSVNGSNVSKVASATSADSATVAASANAVTWSNVSSKPSSYTPASHTHGSITNDGKISSYVTIGSGDRLVITDSSASNVLKQTNITFDGSTTTSFLSQKGTWEVISSSDTKNTTGAQDSTSTLYLIGCTSQGANPVTNSTSLVTVKNGTLQASAVNADQLTINNIKLNSTIASNNLSLQANNQLYIYADDDSDGLIYIESESMIQIEGQDGIVLEGNLNIYDKIVLTNSSGYHPSWGTSAPSGSATEGTIYFQILS